MYSFLVNARDGIICVDNSCYTLPTNLATNLDFVVWTLDASGRSQYNDRASASYPFADPSPYEPQLNAWMAAAAADTPPLQLPQAQQVKSDFAEAVFNAKRQAPIAYSIAAGNFSWDCSDENFTQIVATHSTAVFGSVNTLQSVTQYGVSELASWAASAIVNTAAAVNSSVVAPYNASTINLHRPMGGIPYYSVGTPGVYTQIDPQQLTPIGQASPVTLTGTEFTGLVAAIKKRRDGLLASCLTLKAAIAIAATISAVIDIQVAQGWGSLTAGGSLSTAASAQASIH